MIVETSKTDLAIDINDQRTNTYIQFKMLHHDSFKKEIALLDTDNIIYQENIIGDTKKYFRKILKYEKEHQYQYKKGYKAVSAIKLEVLLPRRLKLKSERVKFAKQFMKQLNPLRYLLPWCTYEVTRGSADYLVFLLNERENINSWEVSRYNRNYYAKDGRLLHQKGSIRHDKNGEVIRTYQEFSSKVRIFTFSKFKNFDKFMEEIKQKFMIAIKNILGKIEKRFMIKKKNAKKIWHFYNRKCVMELNHAKAYVEMLCSKALAIQRMKVTDDEYYERRGRSSPVPKAKEIYSIFYKYSSRFDKGEFHGQNQELYEIKYKKVDLETLQKNLSFLLKELENELKVYVPTVCMNTWNNQTY